MRLQQFDDSLDDNGDDSDSLSVGIDSARFRLLLPGRGICPLLAV
ncbi:MAG TPA: hypothetical protein VME67_20340 [Mycobacterium sp.]|nr:hypothetical protein [Mycobacterium sp.]HTX96982.1 hypothetical protein [Mycobacterium sp.]